MSSEPLVSIVVIFLNAERFLPETLESVLAQTYQSWELLLVDDGSQDGSTAIARAYAAARPDQIRYIEHPNHENRGMSSSRNAGIRAARGKYIALLDADDIWLPRKLERQIALLMAHPTASLVYGKPLYWHSWNAAATRTDTFSGLGVEPDRVVAPPMLTLRSYPLGQGASPVLSDIMFRTSMLERTGLFEEQFSGIYQMYEDQAFLAKVYLSEHVYVAGEHWTNYRQHAASWVTRTYQSGNYDTVRRFFLRWFKAYLDTRAIHDTQIDKAFERAWWPYQHPAMQRGIQAGRLARKRISRVFGAAISRGRAMLQLVRNRRQHAPPVGRVRWGDLGALEPISRASGFRRGLPIDRLYIERFLEQHAADIHGHTLEIGDDAYTRRFGGARTVTRDVLQVPPANPQATIVADLAAGDAIASARFDCIVLTQTLQYIADLPAAIRTLHRILKPGGVLLATVPGLGPISRDAWADRWCWGFTAVGAQQLFEPIFGRERVQIQSFGNVLTATAFLQGLAVADLPPAALECHDPSYQLVITIRAVKAEAHS